MGSQHEASGATQTVHTHKHTHTQNVQSTGLNSPLGTTCFNSKDKLYPNIKIEKIRATGGKEYKFEKVYNRNVLASYSQRIVYLFILISLAFIFPDPVGFIIISIFHLISYFPAALALAIRLNLTRCISSLF